MAPLIPDRSPPVGRRSVALIGGLGAVGYVCFLLVAGWIGGLAFALGPSLLASGVPALPVSLLGAALVGGLAAVLMRFDLGSPAVVVIGVSLGATVVETTSLRPSIASLAGTWAIVAPIAVAVGGIEYAARRRFGSSVRFSRPGERALFGGALAAFGLLLAFSLRGVGPLGALAAAGSVSVPAVAAVFSTFGPPALVAGVSTSLVLRYGLVTPFVAFVPLVALLVTPLGFAFGLFTTASPLLFVLVGALAAGEYVLRERFRSIRPRSLVG